MLIWMMSKCRLSIGKVKIHNAIEKSVSQVDEAVRTRGFFSLRGHRGLRRECLHSVRIVHLRDLSLETSNKFIY